MKTTLDDILSEPTAALVEDLGRLEGDLIVLGAGGKMGPTLARLARRASEEAGAARRVIAVSRFSEEELRGRLESWGVETIACDLLDREEVADLPSVPNVVFMAGRKFGSTGNEGLTWAMNALLPANVCERYPESRIVAFSTGNVYPLSPVERGGSRETDPPGPVGEYAMSCLGRERVFEHYSRARGTRVVLFRLNYACEPRYGVLVDLGRKVYAGEAIDVSMGYFNVIWQGDANALALRSLHHAASPPLVLNVTGPELLRVRDVCEEFGRIFGKKVSFRGEEAPDALLSDASRAWSLFGPPRVSARALIERIAEWIRSGGESLGKPTYFQVRDGRF